MRYRYCTEDKLECGEIKENDPETLETVDESTEDSSATTEEVEYRMDKPSAGAEWFWDDHVFMTSDHQFEENDDESWLLDSGATTHVATSTNNMSNLKTAFNGEHVRVGNNETLKATAIGDLLLEQEGTKKKFFLENVADGCPRFRTQPDQCWSFGRERKRVHLDQDRIKHFECVRRTSRIHARIGRNGVSVCATS